MFKQNAPNIADLVLQMVKAAGGVISPEVESRIKLGVEAAIAQYFTTVSAGQTAVDTSSLPPPVTFQDFQAMAGVGKYAPVSGREVTEPKLIPHVDFMPRTNTYALGVDALQKTCKKEKSTFHPQYTKADGSQIYHPLTLRENCAAMIWDYETLENPDGSPRTREERLRLFTPSWKDSCTSVVTKAGTTKFKVVPQSAGLITIARKFAGAFLPVDYSSVQALELDSASGLYNQLLPESKVPEVEGWRQGVEEDVHLLKALAHIVYTERKRDLAMGFWVRQNTPQDEERALFVDVLGNGCSAGSLIDLSGCGSFLRVAQVEVPREK